MSQQKNKPADQQQEQKPQPITLQLQYPISGGTYTSKILYQIFNTLMFVDLTIDVKEARRKWGFSPLIDQIYADLSNDLINANSDKEVTETMEAAINNAAMKSIFNSVNKVYRNTQFKYKEALQLLQDDKPMDKILAELIAMYFCITNNIGPMDIEPLTAEQREELITLAHEMETVYTSDPGINKEHYMGDTDIPEEYTEAREFFAYFPLVIYYMNYKGIGDLPLEENPFKEAAESLNTGQPQQMMLPSLKPYKLKNYIMPNNTLINDIEARARINYGPYDLSVFGNRSDITTYVAISCEPDPDTEITAKDPEKLSAYQRMLTNAVVSLYVAGKGKGQEKPIFSDEMIYRAMPGAGDKLSSGQKSAITKTLDKLRSMRVTIDATDELRKKGLLESQETYKIDSYYLMLTRAERKLQNGRIVHAYRLEAEPPVYTYANLAKQIISIPVKYLEIRQTGDGKITDKPIRMTPEKQVIADYLLRRIAVIKYDARNRKPKQEEDTQNKKRTRNKRSREETQKQKHNILFSSIFETAGLTNLSNHQKKAYRDFVFAMLDYETAAGYIKGYKAQKENEWEITGIEIIL